MNVSANVNAVSASVRENEKNVEARCGRVAVAAWKPVARVAHETTARDE